MQLFQQRNIFLDKKKARYLDVQVRLANNFSSFVTTLSQGMRNNFDSNVNNHNVNFNDNNNNGSNNNNYTDDSNVQSIVKLKSMKNEVL